MNKNWFGTLFVVMVSWLSTLGCSEDVKRVDTSCFEEGRCACRFNSDCGAGALCIDGDCRLDFTGLIDTIDSGVDADAGEQDATPAEGSFLAPCETDSECNSGRCVEVDGGAKVCTRTCIETCPTGWSCRGLGAGASIGFYCLPDRDRLCEPCSAEAACPAEGAHCIKVGEGTACGRACGDGCPEGYACGAATTIDGQSVEQCLPVSGGCQCQPGSEGEQVGCNVENDIGRCSGVRVCQADGTLGACNARTPKAETCNGVDDDCNGFIDDEVPTSPCEVVNDAGRCIGERLCLPGAGEVCTAATPKNETCDYLDEDCDGQTDEDFRDLTGRIGVFEHCGACGESCEGRFAHATETRCLVPADVSASPRCVVERCAEGYVRVSETSCARPIDLLCAPCLTDSVCGGPADRCLALDSVGDRRFCGRDCGPDSIYGPECPAGYTCRVDGDSSQCVPEAGSCDCSAFNDGQTRPCSVQNEHGTCFGVARCDAAVGWTGCTAKTPVAEVCNGLDEDCDGISDDGLGGAPCLRTNAFGSCPGRKVCDGASGELTCVGVDAAAEVCNGLDDDCDGETDEDFATNVRDANGRVVALKYGLSDAHCGGCNLKCQAQSPATEARCDGSGSQPFCRIEACEDGYWVDDGRVCLPRPSGNLCLPCESDAECLGPNDRCVLGPDGGRCARDCGLGSIYDGEDGACTGIGGERGCCPERYLCTLETALGATLCLPESGDCSCNANGKLRSCAVENAFGRCTGLETCTAEGPDAGWGGCSAKAPAQEVCNGVDDDCDGLVDAADPDIDTSGLEGFPDCARVSDACSGRWLCAGPDGWTCTAREPEPEVCNGRDDDCDGFVDDGYVDRRGQFTTVAHCGGCGLDCRAAIEHLASDESVACEVLDGAPRCVPLACESGFIPFPAGAPRVCLPLSAASCRPCLNDGECGLGGDRCLEVGAGEGTYCAQPCGADSKYAGCTGRLGEQGCCAEGFTCELEGGQALCMPTSGSCTCTQERLGALRECEVSGNGGATTCFGVETCELGGGLPRWSSCDFSDNVEVCDGLDNDCDGLSDEGFTVGGAYVSNAHCGACGRNCDLAFAASLNAAGACDVGALGGPRCELAGCLETTEPAGVLCRDDVDCASGRCDPDRHLCRTVCRSTADCGAGRVCDDGVCATPCASSATCASAFGSQAKCVEALCQVDFSWVDFDGISGNGCECGIGKGLGEDRPDVPNRVTTAGNTYVDGNCDGVDGDISSAIFVRAGELFGDGSLESPFGTLNEALGALDRSSPAATSATPILVAGGVYEEAIELVRGVVLHGGYADDFQSRDIVLYPTIIAPMAVDPSRLAAVFGTGIDVPTELVGFTILGVDATSPGGATYGLLLRDSTSALRVVNCLVVGGRAAPGTPGQNGASGLNGGDGSRGLDSRECADAKCTNGTETQAGGAGGVNAACVAVGCVGMESDTNESPQVKDDPVAGCTYARGGDRGTYQGAAVSLCKYDFSPGGNQVGGNGTDGADGLDASGGAGCADADGLVVGGIWSGGAGLPGVAGGVGGGGNGGAAGGWIVNNKTTACTIPGVGLNRGDLGASGGGGGAGGCGGAGGGGGGSGGASFAVFIAPRGASQPRLEFNTIVRGVGGQGGAGGNGGTGGRGGTGGTGGIALWPAWGAGIGGTGGRGGDGGDAGGGGGGCGGPSYGIAGLGISAAGYANVNMFPLGDGVETGGVGGAGGLSAGAQMGGAGGRGESRNVKSF